MNWNQLWLSPNPTFLPKSTLTQAVSGPRYFQSSAYKKGEPQVPCGDGDNMSACVSAYTRKEFAFDPWTVPASLIGLKLQPTGGGHAALSPFPSISSAWSWVTFTASPTCFPFTPWRPEVEDEGRGRPRKHTSSLFALCRPSSQEAVLT